MTTYYFDASAVVKYFHREEGSAWIKQLVETRPDDDSERENSVYLGAVSIAEVPSALAVIQRIGRIGMPARDLLYRSFFSSLEDKFRILPITVAHLYHAAQLTQRYPLKSYDAVQLAIALDFNNTLEQQNLSLVFVSGDANLVQAARAEGIATDNPFDHANLDSAK